MWRWVTSRRAFVLLALAACGGAETPPATTSSGPPKGGPDAGPSAVASVTAVPATVTRPTGKLAIGDARRYMVSLINRDRATAGLPPVALDEGPPTRAGERHARDMAQHAFLGHWGTDGSIPEQRLTESGGADMVMENAFCITDEKKRDLDPQPMIDPAEIERAEDMFFNEVPPNDGHRKNILKRFHNRVGIGVALGRPQGNEILTPCFTQEFLDVYGTYGAIPQSVTAGAKVHVVGAFGSGVSPGAVGYARLDDPKPLPVSEANRRRAINQKTADVLYWPRGYVSDVYLEMNGSSFTIDVAFPKPGFYELSVWAKFPGEKDYATISLRTITVLGPGAK